MCVSGGGGGGGGRSFLTSTKYELQAKKIVIGKVSTAMPNLVIAKLLTWLV